MWLYFDKNGALLEILEHGSAPRSGTTDFEIFAFFEGIDLDVSFPEATIKLYRPDFSGTSYPILLMDKKVNNVFRMIVGVNEKSKYFKYNQAYTGYYLNFSDFIQKETGDSYIVLDTPGVWKAVITIITSESYNVLGEALFTVQPGIVYEDELDHGLDIILNKVYFALSKKLDSLTQSLKVSSEQLLDPSIGYQMNTLYFVYGVNSDTLFEVVMWNGTKYVTLGTVNLSSYASKEEFDRLENEITLQVEYFVSRLEQVEAMVGNGGPKGVYETLTQLQSQNPDHNYFYIVKEDNSWYYWNGLAWTRGGLYSSPSTVAVSGRTIEIQNAYQASDADRTIVLVL